MLLVVRRKLCRIKEFVAIGLIIPRRSREAEKAANSAQTDRESEKTSMLVCSVRISDFALEKPKSMKHVSEPL